MILIGVAQIRAKMRAPELTHICATILTVPSAIFNQSCSLNYVGVLTVQQKYHRVINYNLPNGMDYGTERVLMLRVDTDVPTLHTMTNIYKIRSP